MLQILPIVDENEKNRVFSSSGLRVPDGKMFFALLEDDEIIGGADISIGEVGTIKSLAIVPEKRALGNGDFFTRALIFKLQSITDKVVIEYTDDYFLKFGFRKDGDRMVADSEKIHFPHACGGE